MTRAMTALMKLPIMTEPALTPEKSGVPPIIPMIGVMRSLTRDSTMAPNATPMMTPTARSMTLPRATKSRKPLSMTPSLLLTLHCRLDLDLNVRGRNCDRSVERSPALEGFDELLALARGDAGEVKSQPNGIEEGDVRANRVGPVHHACDRDARARQRHAPVLRQHLEELDAAGGHT